jgi:hypothetical protein
MERTKSLGDGAPGSGGGGGLDGVQRSSVTGDGGDASSGSQSEGRCARQRLELGKRTGDSPS